MSYTIIKDGEEQIRHLHGARPFAELLTHEELKAVERGELYGVGEHGAVLHLSSPLQEWSTITLRAREIFKEVERLAASPSEEPTL